MTPSRSSPPVFNTLLRHPDIRALVWVDRRGNVKARAGQAISLRIGADDPTIMMPIDTSQKGPQEAIYICQFKGEDFLIVVFDQSAEFETLKSDVDETLKVQMG